MRTSDLILKKRNGQELSAEEIDALVDGYVRGDIPDYQMAALAMAIFFRGMSEAETLHLTLAMMRSGETLTLPPAGIPGIKIDKHSTGGVGDTTTLVLAPLVAAAGVPVVKLAGRALGHTGGTIDKLESIPGFRCDLEVTEMLEAVRRIGVVVTGQSSSLVPADRKLYALRDATATVDSLPLIAASIMSKKLAAGADALVLDVKTGDGALLKEREQAFRLARIMVQIGLGAGRETVALVSTMEQPLGRAIGNALEVVEAIAMLKGHGPQDLEQLCLALGGEMLRLAGASATAAEGRLKLEDLLHRGVALKKLGALIRSQGGDPAVLEDPAELPRAARRIQIKSEEQGFIQKVAAGAIGRAAMLLGAGRETKEATIDPGAGVVLFKKIGDAVQPGTVLAELHAGEKHPAAIKKACCLVREAYCIGGAPVKPPPLILGYIDRNGTRTFLDAN